MEDKEYIYYHNPRCGKSRQGLEILNNRGIEPQIIKYLDDVPSREDFKRLLAKLNRPAEDLVRKNEAYFKEKLKGLKLNEEEWIDVMLENPKLIERPILELGHKAVVGRPPEDLLELI